MLLPCLVCSTQKKFNHPNPSLNTRQNPKIPTTTTATKSNKHAIPEVLTDGWLLYPHTNPPATTIILLHFYFYFFHFFYLWWACWQSTKLNQYYYFLYFWSKSQNENEWMKNLMEKWKRKEKKIRKEKFHDSLMGVVVEVVVGGCGWFCSRSKKKQQTLERTSGSR